MKCANFECESQLSFMATLLPHVADAADYVVSLYWFATIFLLNMAPNIHWQLQASAEMASDHGTSAWPPRRTCEYINCLATGHCLHNLRMMMAASSHSRNYAFRDSAKPVSEWQLTIDCVDRDESPAKNGNSCPIQAVTGCFLAWLTN